MKKKIFLTWFSTYFIYNWKQTSSLNGVCGTPDLRFLQLFQHLHKHIKDGTLPKKCREDETSANWHPKVGEVKIATRQVWTLWSHQVFLLLIMNAANSHFLIYMFPSSLKKHAQYTVENHSKTNLNENLHHFPEFFSIFLSLVFEINGNFALLRSRLCKTLAWIILPQMELIIKWVIGREFLELLGKSSIWLCYRYNKYQDFEYWQY